MVLVDDLIEKVNKSLNSNILQIKTESTGGGSVVHVKDGCVHCEAIEAFDILMDWAVKMEECDCVPCIVSSSVCHKCGRKATIPQERLLEIVRTHETI